MYVENIVQQVQYRFYVWFHHMLQLSLACRIMVHGTQNFHESNLVLMQLTSLHISIHGNMFYHYCQWCMWFCVFWFDTFFQSLFLSDLFISPVRSWTLFGLLLRFLINWSAILWLATINYWWMINFICLSVIPTKNLIFCSLFNCIHFVKFNSSIIFPSLDHHVMNGQRP